MEGGEGGGREGFNPVLLIRCLALLVCVKPASPVHSFSHKTWSVFFFSGSSCIDCIVPCILFSQVHVLQEDWINKSVQLVASCSVTDVNDISVDKLLPLYCTIVRGWGREGSGTKGEREEDKGEGGGERGG